MSSPDSDSGIPQEPPPSTLEYHPSTFAHLSKSIRNSSRSLKNRLRSISSDAEFVADVAHAYGFPVMANRRAGEWYVDSVGGRGRGGEMEGNGGGYMYAGTCYFKSTDGHYGNWGVSGRRLNLNVLEVLARGVPPERRMISKKGVIIVDSTRRGKRYPDSISKTIPIWLCILNRILFPEHPDTATHDLHTPPLGVSMQEASQIKTLIPRFVEEFRRLGIDFGRWKDGIDKPLRPIFVTPESTLPGGRGGIGWEEDGEGDEGVEEEETGFIPVVLVTASRMVKGMGMEGEYVQGAGDDAENWLSNLSLTPTLFWTHHFLLLSSQTDEELEHSIKKAVSLSQEAAADASKPPSTSPLSTTAAPSAQLLSIKCIKPTDSLFVSLKTRRAWMMMDASREVDFKLNTIDKYVVDAVRRKGSSGHHSDILVISLTTASPNGVKENISPPPSSTGDPYTTAMKTGDLNPLLKINSLPQSSSPSSSEGKTHILPLPAVPLQYLQNTKKASKLLRTVLLPVVEMGLSRYLSTTNNQSDHHRQHPITKIIIMLHDPTPAPKKAQIPNLELVIIKEIVIATALFISSVWFDDDGSLHPLSLRQSQFQSGIVLDKAVIRRRLAWLTTSLCTGQGGIGDADGDGDGDGDREGEINISRASLLAVNSVVLGEG